MNHLFCTLENLYWVRFESESIKYVVARLEGKALGRIGLLIHSTAGFVDPDLILTLELSNVANLPIKIYPEMKIGQISFYNLTTPSESSYGSELYGSKYQGQEGPTPVEVITTLVINDSRHRNINKFFGVLFTGVLTRIFVKEIKNFENNLLPLGLVLTLE